MARYVRFVVHQRIRGESRRLGVFAGAYYLRDECELAPHELDRLKQLLAWFEAELTIPPRGTIPDQAIFWFSGVGPFSQRLWELVELLNDHGLTTELITARFVGRIVYRDAHQFAAIPPSRRHR